MNELPAVMKVAETIRAARADKRVLRILGNGTWLSAGAPVEAAGAINTRALSGIIAYEPGDLVITVGAATPLNHIARATLEQGQMLTLDPPGDGAGAIGATIATASCGPLSSAFGTVRDQILGCEFVTGRGEIARAGGRVVKNVAGFDLVRLMTGAWGTLGVITEVTLRLRALPQVDRTVAVSTTAAAAWDWMGRTEVTPYAAELVSPALARALAVGDDDTLLIRVCGNGALVESACESASALGLLREVDGDVWRALAVAEPASASTVRLSVLPSRVARLWERAAPLADAANGFAHATILRGVVRCVLPSTLSAAGERFTKMRGDSVCIGERLPESLWKTVPTANPNRALTERVQFGFDPDRVLNRGILGP